MTTVTGTGAAKFILSAAPTANAPTVTLDEGTANTGVSIGVLRRSDSSTRNLIGAEALGAGAFSLILGQDAGLWTNIIARVNGLAPGWTLTSSAFTVAAATTALQALTATNATVNAGGANANVIIGNTTDAGAFGTVQFRSGTSHYSWLIGAQNNVDEGFEITPSTAAGGTTFTTPVFKVTQAGLATITGGLTVAAGTTAVQALTATSGIIDQGAGDGEILTLRSSDVAHGMTGNTATSTYGSFQKASAAGGGLDIFGWTESSEGVRIFGSGNAEDSTRSTAAVGSISLIGRTISGSSAAGMNANANILVVGNNGTTKYIWDTDGSAFADVEWTTF
jgi:hypothetical protein